MTRSVQRPQPGRSGWMLSTAVAIAATGLLAWTPAAGAATIRYFPETTRREAAIVYRAGPNEVNHVRVTSVCLELTECDSSRFRFTGSPRPRGGPRTGPVTFDSAPERPLNIRVFLGDRADTGSGDGEFFGQAGGDRLTGDDLDGGTGNDRLIGLNVPSSNPVVHEPMFADGDMLTGGLGNDHLDGRAGFDRALYRARRTPVHIDLRRAGPQGTARERDYFFSIEEAQSGFAGDTLIGNAAVNTFVAGPGNDRINVFAGGKDWVFCGPGFDTVRADSSDVLSACERVIRSGR